MKETIIFLKKIIRLKIVKLKCKFFLWQLKIGYITSEEAFKKTFEVFIEIAENNRELENIDKQIENLKKRGLIK